MAAWVPAAGQTLLMPSGPNNKLHLFVILNDPIPLDGYPGTQSVLVCMCSVQPNLHFDGTCTLQPGSHPFVAHPTYIDYKFARIESATDLTARVAQGVFIPNQPCTPNLLANIKSGLNQSKFTKRAFKNLPI